MKIKTQKTKEKYPVKLNLIEQYLKEVSKYPLLTKEEEYELSKLYQKTKDKEIAKKLVTSNLRFVVKIAYEYKNYNVKLIDLIQEGNIGLMKAVTKFNPDRGYRLISYAVWWIKAYIQNYIIKNWSISKIPLGRKNRMLISELIKRERKEFQEEIEVSDAINEIIFEVEVEKRENLRELLDEILMAARDFYLDQEIEKGSGKTFSQILPSGEESQEDRVAKIQLREIVAKKLREIYPTLNEKEKYILTHRILEDNPQTLQEIGDIFNISRERVRQIEKSLKNKLKKKFNREEISVFFE